MNDFSHNATTKSTRFQNYVIPFATPIFSVWFSASLSLSFSSQICMIRDNVKVGSFPISWDGLSISTNGSFSNEVAVGGQDNLIHIYTLDGNTLTEVSWDRDVQVDGFIFTSYLINRGEKFCLRGLRQRFWWSYQTSRNQKVMVESSWNYCMVFSRCVTFVMMIIINLFIG